MAEVQSRLPAGLPFLDSFDVKLIQDLALGMDDDAAIFARYRITPEQAVRLQGNEAFKAQVETARQQMHRTGHIAQVKSRLAAEALIDKLYIAASKSNDVAEMVKAFDALAKVGDLIPKDSAGGGKGGAVVKVELNFGSFGFQPAKPPEATVVDVEVKDETALLGMAPNGILTLHLPTLEQEWA